MSFHLRPVQDRSASPSTSTSTASERSPPPHRQTPGLLPPHPASSNRPRRPLSPSFLRDVDLSARDSPRKYPAPPTGHELMALFPPPPPLNIRPGPTSGYFQREERAFFAQAGKEIVRVRIEVDMPQNEGDEPMTLGREGTRQRQSPLDQRHSAAVLRSPSQTSPTRSLAPMPYPPQTNGRTPRSGPVPIPVQPVFPVPSHGTSQPPLPPNVHPSHSPPVTVIRPGFPNGGSPPHEHPRLALPGNQIESMPEDLRDDDDSWRRPIPHNQRRRAGKHTKRVVVK